MIKHINHQNFLTTPFVVVKSHEVSNVTVQDGPLTENDYFIANEYVDYAGPNPLLNRQCMVGSEHQAEDQIIYEEGISGSGVFDVTSEPKNGDNTYKRLVYSQIKNAFYNDNNNPTQIFGVENIDFPLGRTIRQITDQFRLFNIPQHIFGEKIVPRSVRLYDTSLDDNVSIFDDGYQNLIAGYNLFSKIQEVRKFDNIILVGTSTNICEQYNPITVVSASVDDTMDIGISLFGGTLENHPTEELLLSNIGFYTGSISSSYLGDNLGISMGYVYGTVDNIPEIEPIAMTIGFHSGSVRDNITTVSVNGSFTSSIGFYTGSLINVITSVNENDTASYTIGFYSGSIANIITTVSGSDTSSIFIAYHTGSLITVAIPAPSYIETVTTNVGFYGGSLA